MVQRADELLRLLAETTNRTVVARLIETESEATVTELAAHLVSQGVGPASSTDANDVTETVIVLHHLILPRLDEAGLVDYDPDRRIATFDETATFDIQWTDLGAIEDLLERFEARE